MTTNHIPTIKRWDTHPDRESLRVIYRFLNQWEKIESVSLEPHRTHPRLVRATVTDRGSSTAHGILEVRWYESRDFIITYQTDQTDDTSPLLRWTNSPDAEEVIVSDNESNIIEKLILPSYHPVRNHFHPVQVLPFVIATIRKYTA
jgi:hypothetical protein